MTRRASPFSSALYFGTVTHRRFKPRRHRLSYRVFSMLIDLDELDRLDASSRLFAHNRFSLFSLYDADHGPADGSPLRPWVEARLAEAGIDIAGGPVRLLCYPRILGYAFNPLSVYYCHDLQGRIEAVLYEVRNTFGQRHVYLIPAEEAQRTDGTVRQSCAKGFHVSPFIGMRATYHFRLSPPDGRLSIDILETDDAGPLLHAAFNGARRPFDGAGLRHAFLRHPLMSLKVIAGIHWEALRLWWKGVPVHALPPAPKQPVSIITAKGGITAKGDDGRLQGKDPDDKPLGHLTEIRTPCLPTETMRT